MRFFIYFGKGSVGHMGDRTRYFPHRFHSIFIQNSKKKNKNKNKNLTSMRRKAFTWAYRNVREGPQDQPNN